MIVINDARCSKAQRLRELARQFRLKATETDVPDYVELMNRSAAEFDEVAEHMEGREVANKEYSHS